MSGRVYNYDADVSELFYQMKYLLHHMENGDASLDELGALRNLFSSFEEKMTEEYKRIAAEAQQFNQSFDEAFADSYLSKLYHDEYVDSIAEAVEDFIKLHE